MVVLGIADNHDSGAAVIVDGRLVAAVNQERIDRKKLSGAFPWGAIDAALARAGLVERDVDRIAVGTAWTPSAALRAFPNHHSRLRERDGVFSPLLHAYVVYQTALRASGLYAWEVDACQSVLSRRIAERPFGTTHVELMDHHKAHAHGAYRSQGNPRCLVLTVDAMGDGTTATASMGSDGQLDQLWRQGGLAGVNSFYARVTEMLGFTPNRHEGKVTGLAAHVPPPPALTAHLATRLRFEAPGFNSVSSRKVERKDDAFWNELTRWSREEVASAAQEVLEDAVTAFVEHWVRHTHCGTVAVAGGVFANVRLNQAIAALDCVDTLWVYPHMGDGGLAVGAALGSVGFAPQALATAYLGTDPTELEFGRALAQAELPRRPVSDIVARVADLLAQRKLVARCVGGMEWGPRALGNRSVLAVADDPAVHDQLNARLRRSEFMPFAPVVRSEDASRWFHGVDKVRESLRFMTVCLDATADMKARCPAVVHVDGTARPQVVSADDNPSLHALLGAVGERTGTPVLVNTSFNLHEEPIVATAGDAIRTWRKAKLDALWIGPYVVEA